MARKPIPPLEITWRIEHPEWRQAWIAAWPGFQARYAHLRAEIAVEDEKATTADAPPHCSTFSLPTAILADYKHRTRASFLGTILALAERWRGRLDRVVMVTSPARCAVLRTWLAGCCEPYFNEWPSTDRGGRPRLYFVSEECDYDHVQGLTSLLNHRDEEPWGLVIEDSSPQRRELIDHFHAAHARQATFPSGVPRVIVANPASNLTEDAIAYAPPQVQLSRSDAKEVFTALPILATALLGFDTVRMLTAAAGVTKQFIASSAQRNLAWEYACWRHLTRNASSEVSLSAWSSGLLSWSHWLARLDARYRSTHGEVAFSSKVATHVQLAVDQWRHEQEVPSNDPLKSVMSFPREQSCAAALATGAADWEIRLPRSDESALAQLYQWFLLTHLVEQRLSAENNGR